MPIANDVWFTISPNTETIVHPLAYNWTASVNRGAYPIEKDGILTIADHGQPSNGTVTMDGLEPWQYFMYTPNVGFHGEDSFTYTVSDVSTGQPLTATGTIHLHVLANSAPQRRISNIQAAIGRTSILDIVGKMKLVTDPEGDQLTIESNTQPANGSAKLQNGMIYYTPNTGFQGNDSFYYIVRDSYGNTARFSLDIYVMPGITS
jgi:hypothetical protein